MDLLLGLDRKLILLGIVFVVRTSFACDRLPAGQPLWVRLTAPISTFTAKVGDPVHAVLTQDLLCDDDVVIPMNSGVDGVVRSKRKVGWGIRHETAALEIEFNQLTAGTDLAHAFAARVEEVKNAREQVRKGVIQGIRSSDTFQGRINSRLIHLPTWNPYSDPVLLAYKAVFPIFPEPEIYFPEGTDLRLRTSIEVAFVPATGGSVRESSSISKEEQDRLDQLISQLPWRVTTKKNVDADLLNVVFLGSEDQMKSAFREAGWHNADALSTRSVLKNLYALLNNSGYSQQPMMTLLLKGKPENMNWQKSLNSYGRRDHLRAWRWTPEGSAGSIWVSASTHDTSAVLDIRSKGFVHHIAPDIDDERSAVIRDLNFAGCVRSVSYLSRAQVPAATHNATGDVMHTDGAVAVVVLQNCQPFGAQLTSDANHAGFKPGNYAFRYIRRQILTFRNDILRANLIYGVYDAGRMTVTALRHKPVVQ